MRATHRRAIDIAHWGGAQGVDWLIAEGGGESGRQGTGTLRVFRVGAMAPCAQPVRGEDGVTIFPSTYSIFEVSLATAPEGKDGGLRAIFDVQFAQNRSHVILDRLVADAQLQRDLLIGHPSRDILENLHFTRA